MIEMALMLLIAGLLFSTVAPVYKRVVEEKRSDQTADSIEMISDKLDDYYKTHGHFPDSLSEIYDPVPLDPWGNPYEYLRIQGSNTTNTNASSNSSNASNGKGSGKANNNSQSSNNSGNTASLNTGLGKLRKDKNLVPINSDFDLYSKGPDGQSASPLTASISQDDIVRGRNGTFFGKASEY